MGVSYVTGVLFDYDRTRCVLVLKQRPDWQRGFVNGVGGHIEGDEEPVAAMRREFAEETGIKIHEWKYVLTIFNQQNDARIHFFSSFASVRVLNLVRSTTDEQILQFDLEGIDDIPLIPNMRWIIPVMLAHHVLPFEVIEENRGGFKEIR